MMSTKKIGFLERHGMVVPAQAAEMLNVSVVLVHKWLNEGRFDGAERLPGEHWIIPRKSVIAYNKNRRGRGRPRKNPVAA